MTVRLFIVCASCFFCSWMFAASHEEKKQGARGPDKKNSRLQHEEAGKSARFTRTPVGASATDDDIDRPKSPRLAIPVDVAEAMDIRKQKAGKKTTLYIQGREAGDQSIQFDDKMRDVTHLVLEGTAITDTVLPLTDAIGRAPKLKSIRIVRSDTKDSFLFFLGTKLTKSSGIQRVCLDGNRMTGIGLKSILLGLCRTDNLYHLSWRFMPIQDMVLPFDDGYVRQKRGYASFRNADIQLQMPGETRVYLTPYGTKTPKEMLQNLLDLYHEDKKLTAIESESSWQASTEAPEDIIQLLVYVKRAQEQLERYGSDVVSEFGDGLSVRFKNDPDIYRIIFKDNCVVVSTAKVSTHDITFHEKSSWRFFVEDLLATHHKQLRTLDVSGSVNLKTSDDRRELFALLDRVKTMHHLEMLGLGHIPFDEFSVRHLGKALSALAKQQSLHGETVDGRALKVLHLPGILGKGAKDLSDLKKALHVITLEELDLSKNHLRLRGLHFFGELIPELRALRVLRVGGNKLFVGSDSPNRAVPLFAAGLASRADTLEELDLSKNHIELRDLSHIKEALLACQKLKVLDLRGNRLNDKSWIILKDLVQKLPHLTKIYVGGQSMSTGKHGDLTKKEQSIIQL